MQENDHWGKMLWIYNATFTQAAAGGGTIQVNITASERMELLFGMIGSDDYAAARALSAYILTGAAMSGRLIESISIDNEKVPIPSTGEGRSIAANYPNEFGKRIILGKGDILTFVIASLVQNETFTITTRALISTVKPVITTTGSGGTVTVVTAYDKVI